MAHVRLKEDVGLDRQLRPVRLERSEVRASGKELDGELRRVRRKLRRLVRVALRLGKPIAF